MLVTNRGIVIIMTNPQKSLSNKEVVNIHKKKEKKVASNNHVSSGEKYQECY